MFIADVFVVGGWVVFGEVVRKIHCAWSPIEPEHVAQFSIS